MPLTESATLTSDEIGLLAGAVAPGGRKRRLLSNVAFSSFSTAVGILVYLTVVPLTVRQLGQERVGVWLTLGSLSSLLSVAVMALSGSVQNGVSMAVAKGEWVAAARHVSNAVFVGAGVAIGGSTLLVLTAPVVPWAELFNVHNPQIRNEVQTAALCSLIIPLISLPVAVLQRTLTALQSGYFVDAWRIGSSVLTLPAIYFAARAGAGLPQFVCLFGGLPVFAGTVSVLVAFEGKYSGLRPRWGLLDSGICKKLIASAGSMVAWQGGQVVLAAAPVLLAARLFGPQAAASVGLVQRLSQMPNAAMTILGFALWPAWADALTRGDVRWLKSAGIRLAFATLGFAALLAPLTWFFSGSVVTLWSRGQILVSSNLAAAFALLTAASVIRGALGIPLLAANRTRALGAVTAIAASIGCVPVLFPHLWPTPATIVLWIAGCEAGLAGASIILLLPFLTRLISEARVADQIPCSEFEPL
jgi:O-antigen/teichoic acid export membrane protein